MSNQAMSSQPCQNIILVGAGGSLGSALLNGLLSEPGFTVTALVRTSSKSLPSLRSTPNLRIITIADNYPQPDLLKALANQDALVNTITSTSVSEQYRFIDAAIEAGVKRYVTSEYGLNNLDQRARGLNSVFDEKGAIQDYLRGKVNDGSIGGMTWHAIACGMWIKWSMHHAFLGLHVNKRKMVMWDEGKGLFSCTKMENTVLALVNSLKNPEATANRTLYIQDFATSQSDLLAMIEKVSGKKWSVENVDTDDMIGMEKEKVERGNPFAVYKLIETGFVSGRFGGNLVEHVGERGFDNEVLSLKKNTLEDVVRDGLESFR